MSATSLAELPAITEDELTEIIEAMHAASVRLRRQAAETERDAVLCSRCSGGCT